MDSAELMMEQLTLDGMKDRNRASKRDYRYKKVFWINLQILTGKDTEIQR
jgi:hypothetical protein